MMQDKRFVSYVAFAAGIVGLFIYSLFMSPIALIGGIYSFKENIFAKIATLIGTLGILAIIVTLINS